MKNKIIIFTVITIICLIVAYVINFNTERSLSQIVNVDGKQLKQIMLRNYQGKEVIFDKPEDIQKIVDRINGLKVKKSLDEPSLKIRQFCSSSDDSEIIVFDVSNMGKIGISKQIKYNNTYEVKQYGYFLILNDSDYYNSLAKFVDTLSKT